MANLSDIKADLTELQTTAESLLTDVSSLQSSITDLKGQVAAGSPVSQSDLNDLDAQAKLVGGKLTDVKNAAESIATTPVTA